MNRTHILNHLKILILALVLSAGIGTLSAWTNPPGTPPTCPSGTPGCDAPLHIGPAGQIKSGGLSVGSGLVDAGVGLAVLGGKVGIGTGAPAAKLDVVGPVIVRDSSNSNVWGGELRFLSGTNPTDPYVNLIMENDGDSWGLRFGSSNEPNSEFEVRGNLEVFDGFMRADKYCLGSNTNCITSWPGGGGGGSQTFSCTEARRIQNNAPTIISGSASAIQSVGTGSASNESAFWGMQCVNGYKKTDCSIGASAGFNGGDVVYGVAGGFSGANYCLTDNEEFAAQSSLFITCCTLQ